MPLLPSGPGGVHAPAHAWHLAEAHHGPAQAARNNNPKGASGVRLLLLGLLFEEKALLILPELLELLALQGDHIVEALAL